MATSKKTTGNLVWIILCCVGVMVAPKFFFSQTQDLTVQLTTSNSHGCDVAEFFGGVMNPAQPVNYVRFAATTYQPVPTNPTQLKSTVVLKKPFDVLRIDPCTRSGEKIEIIGLNLLTEGKKLEFTPAELVLECTNCELQLTNATALLVTVHGSDSQLVVKNINSEFLAHSNELMGLYQKLRLFCGLVGSVALIWLVWLLFYQQKTVLVAFGLSNAMALGLFYLLYKKRLLLGFNLPFGDDIFQSGMTFMHLNMYSRYTDVIIYIVPLFVSLGVFSGLMYWLNRRRT